MPTLLFLYIFLEPNIAKQLKSGKMEVITAELPKGKGFPTSISKARSSAIELDAVLKRMMQK